MEIEGHFIDVGRTPREHIWLVRCWGCYQKSFKNYNDAFKHYKEFKKHNHTQIIECDEDAAGWLYNQKVVKEKWGIKK